MSTPVFLSSRLKRSPVSKGRYLVPGDRVDNLDFAENYVDELLATGQATTTPPGQPEPPPPRSLPDFTSFPDQPPDPTPGVRPAWLVADFNGVWPHDRRLYEPGARIDLHAPDRVADMVKSGRATHTRPKREGRSWRLTTHGVLSADGALSQPPLAGNRTEITYTRR